MKKAKKINIWNIDNDIFEPITLTYSTCKKECSHYCSEYPYDFGDCYNNQVKFKREFLKLKLQNISDKIKDVKYDFYWININLLKSLTDLFIVLVS